MIGFGAMIPTLLRPWADKTAKYLLAYGSKRGAMWLWNQISKPTLAICAVSTPGKGIFTKGLPIMPSGYEGFASDAEKVGWKPIELVQVTVENLGLFDAEAVHGRVIFRHKSNTQWLRIDSARWANKEASTFPDAIKGGDADIPVGATEPLDIAFRFVGDDALWAIDNHSPSVSDWRVATYELPHQSYIVEVRLYCKGFPVPHDYSFRISNRGSGQPVLLSE